jgi:hypothetical protein
VCVGVTIDCECIGLRAYRFDNIGDHFVSCLRQVGVYVVGTHCRVGRVRVHDETLVWCGRR